MRREAHTCDTGNETFRRLNSRSRPPRNRKAVDRGKVADKQQRRDPARSEVEMHSCES